MEGISAELVNSYNARQWRQLTAARSLATGVYERAESRTGPDMPLHQHRKMVAKGFELVEITSIGSGMFDGPWCDLVE
jgi:hypothetical protein